MLFYIKWYFFFVVFLLSAKILAGEVQNGEIQRVMVDTSLGNKIFLVIDSNDKSKASCHKNSKSSYVFPLTEEPSNTTLANFILTAHVTKAKLMAIGTGERSSFNELETLKRIEILR